VPASCISAWSFEYEEGPQETPMWNKRQHPDSVPLGAQDGTFFGSFLNATKSNF